MNSKVIFISFFFFLFSLYNNKSYCQEEGETITITTYYPSPYGIYKELRTKKMAIGDNYSDSSQYYWEDTFPNIDSEADLIVEGRVGIGTPEPGAKLEVNGAIKIGDATEGTAGSLRYHGGKIEYHDDTDWKGIGDGGIIQAQISDTDQWVDVGEVSSIYTNGFEDTEGNIYRINDDGAVTKNGKLLYEDCKVYKNPRAHWMEPEGKMVPIEFGAEHEYCKYCADGDRTIMGGYKIVECVTDESCSGLAFNDGCWCGHGSLRGMKKVLSSVTCCRSTYKDLRIKY